MSSNSTAMVAGSALAGIAIGWFLRSEMGPPGRGLRIRRKTISSAPGDGAPEVYDPMVDPAGFLEDEDPRH